LAWTQAASQRLHEEVLKLRVSPVVELFELDLRPTGQSDVLYWHRGRGGYGEDIVFLGVTYKPMPVEAVGFEMTNSGEPPRPKLKILNIHGLMTALMKGAEDLVGSKLTRRRTFEKFLDGQPEAADVQFPEDIFFVVQKLSETRTLVEFELGSGLDLDGVQYPRRQVMGNFCGFRYRGAGCRFTSASNGILVVAGPDGQPLPSVRDYVGLWAGGVTYYVGQSVVHNDRFWVCTVQGTGEPGVSADWDLLQTWRGTWNSATSYAVNDVVAHTLYGNSVAINYIAIAANLDREPPNSDYWTPDVCAKTLLSCLYRFDPRASYPGTAYASNFELPFGGFPGIVNLPGT